MNTKNAPELLPCPFCGCKKALLLPATQGSTERCFPKVRCGGCFTDVAGENDDYSEAAKSAVVMWNTRAALQPQVSEGDVEAARVYTRKVAETIQEGNKLDDPVADNGYTVEDALMHLFPFSNRQTATVSAIPDAYVPSQIRQAIRDMPVLGENDRELPPNRYTQKLSEFYSDAEVVDILTGNAHTTDLSAKLAEAEAMCEKLAGALDKLVSRYIANPDTEFEFVCCITPPNKRDWLNKPRNSKEYINSVWHLWNEARDYIAAYAAYKNGVA